MIHTFLDKAPIVHRSAFVAESAHVIGDVAISENSGIFHNAVLRADVNYIRVGRNSNVQDNATVHAGKDSGTKIGDYVSIGHNAVVHGCTIGNSCIIGMGAIVMTGATIGNNCIIGAGSVVTEGKAIPDNSLVLGVPGRIARALEKEDRELIQKNAQDYVFLSGTYRKGRAQE